MAYVIVADDDEIVGEVACGALIDAGHVAGSLGNGIDALRVIKSRKPDLVVLDCNMPQMSGLNVLRELRDSIEFHTLPVLILTGRQSEKDEAIAFHEGATDYMKKPFDPDELVFRVNDLLEKSTYKRDEKRPTARKSFNRFGGR